MNLDLKTFSTFKLGGIAHKTYNIKYEEDIEKINSYAQSAHKPLIIIGEGSNSIFGDSTDKYIVAQMSIKGMEVVWENQNEAVVKVAAGEIWDSFVNWSVEHNLSGIESLSAIPGTVGASPVQNIGAYGREISDVIVSVKAFNRENGNFEELSKEDCEFAYRDSIFKKNKEKYIITYVTFVLKKNKVEIPQYKDVQEFFVGKNPSLKEIREAIIQIRASKLPNYKEYPNCGSFFKNPVVSKNLLEKIKETFPQIPSFEITPELYKLFAGWLIENANYESAQSSNFYFHPKNKLILVHTGFGSFEEFQKVVRNIIQNVQDKFGVRLEPEANIFI